MRVACAKRLLQAQRYARLPCRACKTALHACPRTRLARAAAGHVLAAGCNALSGLPPPAMQHVIALNNSDVAAEYVTKLKVGGPACLPAMQGDRGSAVKGCEDCAGGEAHHLCWRGGLPACAAGWRGSSCGKEGKGKTGTGGEPHHPCWPGEVIEGEMARSNTQHLAPSRPAPVRRLSWGGACQACPPYPLVPLNPPPPHAQAELEGYLPDLFPSSPTAAGDRERVRTALSELGRTAGARKLNAHSMYQGQQQPCASDRASVPIHHGVVKSF